MSQLFEVLEVCTNPTSDDYNVPIVVAISENIDKLVEWVKYSYTGATQSAPESSYPNPVRVFKNSNFVLYIFQSTIELI